MSDSKIIEKIKKLLELASNANENDAERSLAMQRAQDMMLKHAIAENEISLQDAKELEIIREDYHNDIIFTKQGVQPVFPAIMAIIAPLFGCQGLQYMDKNGAVTKYGIVGFKHNVEVVKYAVDSILQQGLLAAREAYKIHRTITFGNSFWSGYAMGLTEKFSENVKRAEGIELYDRVKNSLKGLDKTEGQFTQGIANKIGKQAGLNAEIRKPIEEKKSGVLLQ